VLAGKVFQGIEAALQDPHTNRTVVLHLSAKALDIPSDGRLGCIITMTDLTERKHAERLIRRYASRLERSNKDLEDFAFIASHDLKEPLRKIQSFGRLLTGKYATSLGKEGSDYTLRMQEAANRMEKMVNDLLSYSRVATQSRPYEQVDLNLILNNVLSDLEGRITRTGGIVERGELPTIDADPIQMHQLFQNLLSNALKFHKPDEQPRIKVTSRPVPEEENAPVHYLTPAVEILVQDNGIGFEMEYHDRIFQPFQRLHGRADYEGSGIGLSICWRIVERHRGRISATSRLGVGTTFHVILPVMHNSADMEM
jgi:light-regulated signal transduction histidine kinase (bacteriophytochrome)